MLFSDSAAVGNLTANDTSNRDSPVVFDLIATDPSSAHMQAHYQLIYSVSQPGVVDDDPSDNTRIYDFYATENSFSKSRLNTMVSPSDPVYLQPLSGPAYTVAGGGALRWGHLLKTGIHGNSSRAKVQSITFAATTNTADSLSGESVNLELYKWVDASNDNVIDESEVTLMGSGFHSFETNSERGIFMNVPITDAASGDSGVVLEANSRYVTCVNYGGTVSVFIAADEKVWDYDSNFVFSNFEPQIPLFNGTDWSHFSLDIQVALRTDIDSTLPFRDRTLVSIKQDLGTLTNMSVHPNPAQSMIQVSVGDKVGTGSATISIRDLAGREVYNSQQPLAGTASYYKIGVGSLPAGLYNVMVSTGRGSKTQKLVITR